MQENWLELSTAFNENESCTLATIINTQGATYQKLGTMMLINQSGKCSGLLSGGCLEADIALHAEQVLATGKTKVLHYDLSADADLLWGLGLGCEGKIDILLQPLTPQNNHLSFRTMLHCVLNGGEGHYYQLITDEHEPRAIFSLNKMKHNELVVKCDEQANHQMIHIPVYSPLSLVICGAGPDVIPVVNFATELGWQVSLFDHRQSALNQPQFSHIKNKQKIRPEYVTSEALQDFDAMVIMTHNLDNDQLYLKHGLAANLFYIGLLGPINRRDKLCNNLSISYQDVRDKVFGPIGLNLGGRSPQAIGLSIVAQIQQQFHQTLKCQLERPQCILLSQQSENV